MDNKKVLIIGINGFLGQNLANFFKKQNIELFGTTHSKTLEKNIFKLSIGDEISEELLKYHFSSIIYLTHNNDIQKEKLIEWYKKTFFKFKNITLKQIYISSYSANKNAISNYGESKFEIENFFIQNGGYSISPGLIIGKGGIFYKIVKFIDKSPLILLPINKKQNLMPIVSAEMVCSVIYDITFKDFSNKNYNIYSQMINFKELIAKVIKHKTDKKLLFTVNSSFVLFLIKTIEAIGIKLPVSSDSLKGFIANQGYFVKSDIDLFGKDLELDDMIIKYLTN